MAQYARMKAFVCPAAALSLLAAAILSASGCSKKADTAQKDKNKASAKKEPSFIDEGATPEERRYLKA